MAIVEQTPVITIAGSQTNGSGTQTLSYTVGAGANGLLFASFFIAPSVTINSVQYAGVDMTLVKSITIGTWIYRTYALASPTTGTNDFVLSTDTNFSLTRLALQAFTGTSLGVSEVGVTGSSPVSDSITVSANSKLYVIGIWSATSGTPQTLEVDDVLLTKEYTIQQTNTLYAGISAVLTAGTKTTKHSFPSGTGNLFNIELLDGGGGGGPESEANFFPLF